MEVTKKEEIKKEGEEKEKEISVRVGNRLFKIKKEIIPQDSILDLALKTTVPVKRDENGNIVLDSVNKEGEKQLQAAFDFILGDGVPISGSEDKILFLGFNEEMIYEMIMEKEKYFKDNMRKKEFETHPMNTDPYYDLIKITPEIWGNFCVINSYDKENLLFNFPYNDLEKESFPSFTDSNFETNHVFVAGGAIFGSLFGQEFGDVDHFIYGCDSKEAKKIIERVGNMKFSSVERTKNSMTFFTPRRRVSKEGYNKVQYILRLYRTPSEILHGFDIDSCCMGYDGKDIWMTRRCLFSLVFGYNTMNFDLFSPSYEWRLAKYGERGMKVKVPGFERSRVNKKVLFDIYNSWKVGISPEKGLETLLCLELSQNKFCNRNLALQKILEKHTSDYEVTTGEIRLTDAFKKFQRSRNFSDSDVISKPFERLRNFPPKNYLRHDANKIYPREIKKNISSFSDLRYNSQGREKKDEVVLTKEEILSRLANYININYLYKDNCEINKISLPGAFFLFCLHIPDAIRKAGQCFGWAIPKRLKFKKSDPGSQVTGSFHKTVLENNDIWYKSLAYEQRVFEVKYPEKPLVPLIPLIPNQNIKDFRGGSIEGIYGEGKEGKDGEKEEVKNDEEILITEEDSRVKIAHINGKIVSNWLKNPLFIFSYREDSNEIIIFNRDMPLALSFFASLNSDNFEEWDIARSLLEYFKSKCENFSGSR